MRSLNRLSLPKLAEVQISFILRYVYGMMGFDGNTCTAIVETVSLLKVNLEKPCVGMLVKDTEEVHSFNTNYARSEGLSIRGSSNMGLNEKLRYLFYIGVFKRRKWVQYLEE